ncbi:Ribosome biogenesis GTPase RsgA, putative [Ostreococcus tauri]|uniref:Ribosome biogenesis GTPase RsgA, putative n=1 Tax=Ostreococcus tauri TaxID=70448 RepID=Q010M4_OSTTA|nr:Ribosome biogenesis GTPase RsgA, putative [Ostreococcus tauri]CAL56008.1 Ribosome biogenesis GTPase RsgA, putative [Ostreococcus tauri]|eukprot:XP_003081486.1 Ribosome biogenesis GTPase RsgA, putative [Ostreococcus tauri]
MKMLRALSARASFGTLPRAFVPSIESAGASTPRPRSGRAYVRARADAERSVETGEVETTAALVGTVVTAQANFLRVVVNGDAVIGAHARERRRQVEDAKSRASEAGASSDVERLDAMLAREDRKTELLCVARALLKKIKKRVLVGDEVELSGIDWVENRAVIDDVVGRRSELVEPPIANVDQALLVFSLEQPPLEAKQLTRFLVSMEATKVPFTLVLNKCELLSDEEVADWRARLEGWGYDAKIVSVATGRGVDELEEALRGKTTVLAGPSGVGKSSLINRFRYGSALAGALESVESSTSTSEGSDSEGEEAARYITDLDIEGGGGGGVKRGSRSIEDEKWRVDLASLDLQSVKGVGSRSGRGRHTTRHVSLLTLDIGGFLADTPGFGYPSLEGFDTEKLAMCFPEIRNAIENSDARCQFADCTHRHEPGCAVADECWEEQRYDLYYELFEEVKQIAENERQAYFRESRVKTKSATGKDATRIEAKLETKSHRRVSRRRARMETADLRKAVAHDADREDDREDDFDNVEDDERV